MLRACGRSRFRKHSQIEVWCVPRQGKCAYTYLFSMYIKATTLNLSILQDFIHILYSSKNVITNTVYERDLQSHTQFSLQGSW